MANEQELATWNTYQDAWADISAEERRNLLTQSVVEDCVFADPTGERSGLETLIAYIEDFQKQNPGHSFKTHRFCAHHGRSIADWIMSSKEGQEVLPGTSIAFYRDGKLASFAGFWEV